MTMSASLQKSGVLVGGKGSQVPESALVTRSSMSVISNNTRLDTRAICRHSMLNRTYFSTPVLDTDDFNLPSCHPTFCHSTMLPSSVQKIFTLVVFSSAAVCCAVLGILLLKQDNIAKAGIATLTVGAHF